MTRRNAAWQHEHGFTLVEVMITILLMGIVFAIATSTWFGVVESRRVDSATNQLAADLRLAHSKATNRLTNHSVVVPSVNSSTYRTGPTEGTLATRTLPEGIQIAAATTIIFRTNGEAQVTGANPIEVRSSNNSTNKHRLDINTMTSRVKIDP